VLGALATALMSEDWDTWDESQERFKDDAVVVAALDLAAGRYS
jgi:hypothetical protein